MYLSVFEPTQSWMFLSLKSSYPWLVVVPQRWLFCQSDRPHSVSFPAVESHKRFQTYFAYFLPRTQSQLFSKEPWFLSAVSVILRL